MTITISRNVNFMLRDRFRDPGGIFFLLKGLIDPYPLTPCNLYFHKTCQLQFLERSFTCVFRVLDFNIIIAGDLNLYLSPLLDRHSIKTKDSLRYNAKLSRLFPPDGS